MSKKFFISDLHFGHSNALRFDHRPFETIEEHDSELIRRWNASVGKNDEVYILGDVSWRNPSIAADTMKQLNGRKYLIAGNHDFKLRNHGAFRSCFEEICDYKVLRMPDKPSLVLCHFPIPCFDKHLHGQIHLYGHVHISWESELMEHVKHRMQCEQGKPCHMYNVGAMMPYMDYTPRTIEEILDGAKGYMESVVRKQSEESDRACV